ncbi:hypothetical protein [Microbulbifer variabilis]|uniref:hypothetical protein n=1 Tax=Microbulbifer variabilis TaxID=266805 RepID=UPI000361DA58|nr:hypothetical protein [Microbulbifer variabilis]
MTKLAITLTALLLAGCSATTSLTQKSSAEVRQGVTTIHSTIGNPGIAYSGPPMQATTDGSDLNLVYYELRAFEPETGGSIRYRLVIDITYRVSWRNYVSAAFSGRTKVNVTQLEKSVLNCTSVTTCMLEETLEVPLEEEQIVSALKRRESLRVKLRAKSGHRSVVEIPTSYLMGFYAAIVNRQG